MVFCVMERYTFAELRDMQFMYGRAIGNAKEAQRLYRSHYPNRRQLLARKFQAVHRRLGETSALRPLHHVGRRRSIRTVEIEEEVLAHVQKQSSTSTRAIAHTISMSQISVWRILHDNQMHPLELADFPQRAQFCE